ncbi:MAG: MoxR family ATPase [Pseudomonadota bacterium]|nr:MoxR family ATPase [Pseudomonadota bacterium]MEC8006127.1 MoxR family ATPase [Pseudomonadota bacterium]
MPADLPAPTASVETITAGLAAVDYIASRPIATALLLARDLGKPVLVEGSAGVGKTELALSTARWLSLPLIRMQCYEGLDESKALYEWKYGKQLLYTQLLKDKINEVLGETGDLTDALGRLANFSDMFFSEQFLEPRPLLQALREPEGAVLLIDEVDKANEEFEAFLLEILSAFQVTIPEIGTITAARPPLVFLTSNNTRDMSDALKRRCLHLHIPLPDARLEAAIVTARVPGIDARLTRQVVAFVQALRALDLKKLPSISETLDWARAIVLLHGGQIDRALVRDTLNVLLKFEADIDHAKSQMTDLLRAAEAAD